MSRSRKKHPITGICSAKTMPFYRALRAGRERAKQRLLLQAAKLGDEDAAAAAEVQRVPWNEWDCPRDGKQWVACDSRYARK